MNKTTESTPPLSVRLDRRVMRRGPGDRKPLDYDQSVISWRDCPDCGGRGYFLIQPFKTGGSNGCGGIGNTCQCLTCLDVSQFYEKHGFIPELIKPHNLNSTTPDVARTGD